MVFTRYRCYIIIGNKKNKLFNNTLKTTVRIKEGRLVKNFNDNNKNCFYPITMLYKKQYLQQKKKRLFCKKKSVLICTVYNAL